jgi:hypothetical protein
MPKLPPFKKINITQNDTIVFLTTNLSKQAFDNVYKLWTSVGLEKLGERQQNLMRV